ncbi:MAG: ROK family protein [Gaiellaceae bacterium MAG52_C11]|nr:ROK family protein [Candidatus Gaiellasilicea maunaloa]
MTAVGSRTAVSDGSDTVRPAHVLGLDIGGTKLAAGVVDSAGRVRSFIVESTNAEDGPERGLDRLFELGRRAVDESGVAWTEIEAVGIGAGGPLDTARGVLIAPPHLPGWCNVPLAARAEEAFGLPVALENDATAAAAGEHRYGAGAGTSHMVYLTISTGVGGGIVIDGRLYRGASGNGGELGHVTVDCDGRLCRGCGRKGCLEAYVSGTSIAERAREAGMGDVTAGEVAAAAKAGDALAIEVWEATVDALACGLTSIVNLLEPQVVVLGGGVVSGTGEQLLGPVRDRVRAEAMTTAGEAAKIVQSALGTHVGVVGAAAIAAERTASSIVLDG